MPAKLSGERAARILLGGCSDPMSPATISDTWTVELRSHALRNHAQAAADVPLADVWRRLEQAAAIVVDHFNWDQRCYLVLRREPARARTTVLGARNLEIFRRILLGEPQKVLALELGLAASSVALVARQCAGAMGMQVSATRLPTVVIMAAHTSMRGSSVTAKSSSLVVHDACYEMLSVERLAPSARFSLSAAERNVVDLLVDRHSNAEIARIRRTSTRTVANQLTNVLHKLRARGRSEVLLRLIENHA